MGMEVGPVLDREAGGLKYEIYFLVLGGQCGVQFTPQGVGSRLRASDLLRVDKFVEVDSL